MLLYFHAGLLDLLMLRWNNPVIIRFGIFHMRNSLMIGALLFMSALNCHASEQHYRFHLVVVSGDYDSPHGKSMRRFSELVKERSSNRGNLHMALAWPQTAYDQRMGVNFLPYLTIGWEDALAAYAKDGWLTQLANEVFTLNGLKYFGPYPEGFGGIATKKRYTTSVHETAGIKLRSQTIFPLPQTIQAMGFDAVPIDWSEVYTSLQTGVVDGDSSNVIYWDYEYFGDLSPNLVLIEPHRAKNTRGRCPDSYQTTVR